MPQVVLCWEIRLEMLVVPFEEDLELFSRSVSFISEETDNSRTLQVMMHHDQNSAKAKERLGVGGHRPRAGVRPAQR